MPKSRTCGSLIVRSVSSAASSRQADIPQGARRVGGLQVAHSANPITTAHKTAHQRHPEAPLDAGSHLNTVHLGYRLLRGKKKNQNICNSVCTEALRPDIRYTCNSTGWLEMSEIPQNAMVSSPRTNLGSL